MRHSTGQTTKKKRYSAGKMPRLNQPKYQNQRRQNLLSHSRLIALMLAGCVSLLSGCASSVLQPYPSQMQATRSALSQSATASTLVQYNTFGQTTPQGQAAQTPGNYRPSGPNKLLHFLEQGRIAQLQQADDASLTLYRDAISLFESQAFDAHLDLSNTAQTGTAFLTNDNARPYRGEHYERSFLHLYQALNYLFQKNLEGAAVEVRRLNRIQREALAKNEKVLAELSENAQTQLSELPIDNQSTHADIDAYVAAQDAAAQNVKHGFQNAYGFFVSGLIYELRGDDNDAYIDYKKAQALNPAVPFLQHSLLRLAKTLGFTQEYARWQRQFKSQSPTQSANANSSANPNANPSANSNPAQGEVVVLYESGLVPVKKEAALSVPDLSGRYHSFSFPYYDQSRWASYPLRITTRSPKASTSRVQQTHVLTDTYPLAAKALKDKRAALIARQLTRSVAKAQLHTISEKEGGALGSVLANIYNIITERADLRSWLTLPRTLQASRFNMPNGAHVLNLKNSGLGANHQHEIVVNTQGTTLVYVTTIGRQFYVRSVAL